MPILDYILYFALGVVIYYTGRQFYMSHITHKLNMKIIDLYLNVPNLNRAGCREALDLLEGAEKAGANMRYIETARELIKIQKEVLDAQNTIKDGL